MSTSAARRSKRVSAAGASETEESETDDDVRDEEDDAYGELGEVSCSSTISTLTILTGRKNLVSRQFGELRVLISSVSISKNYSRYKHAHRKEDTPTERRRLTKPLFKKTRLSSSMNLLTIPLTAKSIIIF